MDADPTIYLIIPPLEARRVVQTAGQVYVRDCGCRVQQQRCPPAWREVCLLFEHASQEDRDQARPITPEEAVALLDVTWARGVIYRLFFTEAGQQVTELCSCCDCCCFPHQEAKQMANYRQQLRSEYVAVTDTDRCTDCGLCLESCFFEAHRLEDGRHHFADERCFGCGRCIESCPEGVIRLERQVGRGISLPV